MSGELTHQRHYTTTQLESRLERLAPPKNQGSNAGVFGTDKWTRTPSGNINSSRTLPDQPTNNTQVHPCYGKTVFMLDKCPWPMHLQGLPFLQGRWAPPAIDITDDFADQVIDVIASQQP